MQKIDEFLTEWATTFLGIRNKMLARIIGWVSPIIFLVGITALLIGRR